MNWIVAATLAGLIAAGSATAARAEQPGADWMPAEQVKQKLMQSGYTQITDLKADDGRWEGEGVKNGKKMDFHADPKTGAITNEKLDD
ncbi:PepSY domain-containing protein [Rhodopseudomonas palustris]|uniref:PepSY domain-containing protein n=1 Tax=Rhodopseudomonas palustris (strain BisB18) TaxID=316056 RepID=Q217U4_RHOPB